jgi:hypothetical protein
MTEFQQLQRNSFKNNLLYLKSMGVDPLGFYFAMLRAICFHNLAFDKDYYETLSELCLMHSEDKREELLDRAQSIYDDFIFSLNEMDNEEWEEPLLAVVDLVEETDGWKDFQNHLEVFIEATNFAVEKSPDEDGEVSIEEEFFKAAGDTITIRLKDCVDEAERRAAVEETIMANLLRVIVFLSLMDEELQECSCDGEEGCIH